MLNALAVLLAAVAVTPKPAVRTETLRAHLRFLADDRLEGRGVGTRGGEIAARYIAAQLEAAGLSGAAEDGGFLQKVSLTGVKLDPTTVLSIEGATKTEHFAFATEFVAFTGAQTEHVEIDAPLVFAGYGITAPGEKWDDYQGDPARYRGKVLVVLVNDPPPTAEEPTRFGGKALTWYGRWTYKLEEAARRGAAGVILVHTDESAGYPWSVVRTSNGSWRYDLTRGDGDTTPFLPMRAWVTETAARRLFAATGADFDSLRAAAATRGFTPVDMKGSAKITLASEVRRIQSENVAALIPGGDAKLGAETVIFSAHWDHLGIGAPDESGDTIYNGAIDNASGCASLIAAAQSLMTGARPKRSVLFLATTAEEQGLLGADWYTQHPLRPIASTVADVNLDSMNLLGAARNILAQGAETTTLPPLIEGVLTPWKLVSTPDPRPEQGGFFRGDNFPFAKAGIPSVQISAAGDYAGHEPGWSDAQFRDFNLHHYHQPSDSFHADWDYAGMVLETQVAIALTRKIADAPVKPAFLPSSPFARK